MTAEQALRASRIHTVGEAIALVTYREVPNREQLLDELWTAIADLAMGVDEPYVIAEVHEAEALLRDPAMLRSGVAA